MRKHFSFSETNFGLLTSVQHPLGVPLFKSYTWYLLWASHEKQMFQMEITTVCFGRGRVVPSYTTSHELSGASSLSYILCIS